MTVCAAVSCMLTADFRLILCSSVGCVAADEVESSTVDRGPHSEADTIRDRIRIPGPAIAPAPPQNCPIKTREMRAKTDAQIWKIRPKIECGKQSTDTEKTTWIALAHHVTTVEKPPAQSKHEGTDTVVRIGTWVRCPPVPRPLRRGRHTPPHSHSAHRMVQARNTRAPRRPRAHATPLTRHRTHTDSRRHFNCLTVIIAGRPFSRSRHRASVDAILAMASRRILVHTPPLTDDEINCVCV